MKATPNGGRGPAAFSATKASSRNGFGLLQGCFLLSGVAGLIYQVAWMKSLGLLFGYTAYATATAIAVFMAGLALGSFFLGRWSDKQPDALKTYAWLEFGIGFTGALSLAGLAILRVAYLSAYPYLGSSSAVLLCFRVAGAALVLGIPSFLMGGTFPVVVRGAVRQRQELSWRVGRLYAINTLGAVIGTLAAGFYLLPAVGLRMAVLVAAAINFIAGAIALRIHLQPVSAPPFKQPVRPLPQAEQPWLDGWRRRVLFGAFTVVGFTAIAYEVAWTRMLATFLGSSTYAFTLMLGTFLLGIVIGSLLFTRYFSGATASSVSAFAWTQTAISLAVLLFFCYLSALPELIPKILRSTDNSFGGMVLAQFVVCSLAMLPAAILFGVNFPLAIRLLVERDTSENRGAGIGRAYALNTAGGIAGALLSGFLLLPLLGSFRLTAVLAACNALLAISLLALPSRRNWLAIGANFVTVGVLAYLAISGSLYSKTIAGFGALLYGNYHDQRLTVREIADTEHVLFFQDGVNATISVTRTDDYVALKTNGKVDASNLDTSTQLLLGDLGAIFHPHAKRVLIVGLGGGMTASAVARFPDVERIDCLEIEPAVLHAQPFLTRLNRGVLADPRFHLIFDDARNYLQTTSARYDLIISEPSNPWIAGISALYTREFYAALRQKLEPDGIFVQWVQAYGLSPDDFRMIVASLGSSFADLSLWRSGGRDYLLLARPKTAGWSFDRSRKLWGVPELQQDFQTLKLVSPESWMAYFRLADADLRKMASGASLNTDDWTKLEFETPKRILAAAFTEELARYIDGFSSGLLPKNLPAEDVPLAQLAAAETALDLNDTRAAQWLATLPAAPPGRGAYLKGRLALQQGRAQEAAGLLAGSSKHSTNTLSILYWLAAAEAQSGGAQAASDHLEQILAQRPRDQQALAALVRISEDQKDWDGAIRFQERLLDMEAGANANSFCRLGDFFLRKSDLVSAQKPLRQGIERDPYVYLCHRDLGELLRASGKLQEAEVELRFVVTHFPEADSKVYASLALLYKLQGKKNETRAIVAKGRRIFPEDSLLLRFERELNLPSGGS